MLTKCKSFFIIFLLALVSFPCFAQQKDNKDVRIKNTHFEGPVESVRWFPDGSSYITTNGSTLLFWDSETDTVTSQKNDYDSHILGTRLSPDGISLATIYADNTFIVQDIVTQKYFTQQKGLSDIPIFDTVFIDDYYTMLVPLDGQNIYSFFCLLHTNEALIEPGLKEDSYVYGLDVDKSGKYLLITFSDGKIQLVDIATKEILHETQSHSIVSITSEFSPNGQFYLYQADENSVRIASVKSHKYFEIKDYDKPINTADFTPNGKSVAIADSNGFVKVYNIEKGYVEDAIKLPEGDIAFTCDFSPDGKSLLIGTKDGGLIRWWPNFSKKFTGAAAVVGNVPAGAGDQIIVIEDDGKNHPGTQRVVNDPDSDVVGIKVVEKQATDEDVGEYITIAPTNPLSKLFRKNINLNPHNLYAVAGLGTINSDNFWGNIRLKAGYLNYKPFPFYWGGDLGFELGLTSKNFPYHYRVGKVDLGAPILLAFAPAAVGGFHYLFEKPEILVFAELELGANIRILASSSVQYPFAGAPATSFFADLALGAEWKFLRASVDVQLDTNFVYSVGGTLGATFKLPSKNQKVANTQGGNS